MKILYSVFQFSVSIFLLVSLPTTCSWIFYLSATIHKNYMFLLCNGLLVFISLNSRSISGLSPGKYYGEGQTGNSGDELVADSCESKQLDGSRMIGGVEDKKEIEHGSLYDVRVRENGYVIAEDEDEEVDKVFSVIEETPNDELKREREGEVAEDDKSMTVVEETRNDELEVEDGKEPEGGPETISLEELNKKCEEFIRRMKEEIRFESSTILCN